jgi:hypothetical protein
MIEIILKNKLFLLLIILMVATIVLLLLSGPSDSNNTTPVLPGDNKTPNNCICGDGICYPDENCIDCPEDCPCEGEGRVTVELIDLQDAVIVTLINEEGQQQARQSGNKSIFVFEGIDSHYVSVVVENPETNKRTVSSMGELTPDMSIDIRLSPSFFTSSGRELDENVFRDTIGIATEDDYKEQGYVIVRYFYNQNCPLCKEPVDWMQVLEEVAAEMNDVVILETFDTYIKKWAAENWASTALGGRVADPSIRMEGMPGGERAYKLYYAGSLADLQENPKESLRQEICGYTDVC